MRKNHKDNDENISLIPAEPETKDPEELTGDETPAETGSDNQDRTETDDESGDEKPAGDGQPAGTDAAEPADEEEQESETQALFGAYVAEENKWERKLRIQEEKDKRKQAKKRAKYADVDDETYERMKAGSARKFFGVCSLLLLICGIAAIALFVYRLAISPDYAQVGVQEEDIHIEGFATETDASQDEQQVTPLTGIATPSDLTDTWMAQEFTPATETDAQQNLDGIAIPEDSADETTEVQE